MLKLNIQQMVNQRNLIPLKNIILLEQFQLFNQNPKKETPCGLKAIAPQESLTPPARWKNVILTKQNVYLTLKNEILINRLSKFSNIDRYDSAQTATAYTTVGGA